MPRRPLPRHVASYGHVCPMLGGRVGLDRAIRWSPVSRRLARHRPPSCPVCGGGMALERVAYQPAAADSWDPDPERTSVILGGLALEALAREREPN